MTEPVTAPASAALSPADRAAIEELLAGYVLALDVGDIDAATELFTEDGEFHTYGHVFAGAAKVRRMFEGAPTGLHMCGRSLITAHVDGAAVRSQLVFYPADRSAHRLTIYDDIVVRTEQGWRFRVRECRFLNAEGILDVKP